MNSNYPCSQQELYTACRLGWNSCKNYLQKFTEFKAKYDQAFITAALAKVEEAVQLPDSQQRGESSESHRIQLVNINEEVLRQWQRLKSYITDAYPEDQLKPKLESAGQLVYAKAANNNWNSVQALLKSANDFLTQNGAALTANQNMPATFPAAFATLKTNFDNQYQLFLKSESGAGVETSKKIAANNEIYASLTKMFSDGQQIFSDDAEVKKQFTFDKVVAIAGGGDTPKPEEVPQNTNPVPNPAPTP